MTGPRPAPWLLLLPALAAAPGVAAQDAAPAPFSTRLEVTLPGAPEAVYDAITGDISGWWDHRFSEAPARLVLEPRPGGRFLEIFDESGDGALHATVIYADRGRRLRFDGPLGFSGRAVQIVTTYEFERVGADSTRLVVEVHAAGIGAEAERSALEGVWRHFIVDRFKPYVEARHAAGRPPAGG